MSRSRILRKIRMTVGAYNIRPFWMPVFTGMTE